MRVTTGLWVLLAALGCRATHTESHAVGEPRYQALGALDESCALVLRWVPTAPGYNHPARRRDCIHYALLIAKPVQDEAGHLQLAARIEQMMTEHEEGVRMMTKSP